MTDDKKPRIVILGDMRDLHHHGCEAVVAELIRRLSFADANVETVSGLDWQKSADLCLSSELVVINGEGALHHSRPAIAWIVDLAQRRKKLGLPTALINTSWFCNSEELTKALSVFDIVSSRESLSAAEISKYSAVPFLAPDLAISHALARNISRKAESGVLVSDSTKVELSKQLYDFAKKKGWRFLPVLAYPTEKRNSKKSRKIHRRTKIAKKLPFLASRFLPRYYSHSIGLASVDEYLQSLADSSALVTGRFHAVCFAIALKIPFLAIASNTSKIEALIADVGLDPARRIVSNLELSSVNAVVPFSAAELVALEVFLRSSENKYADLFAKLRELLH